MYKKAVIYSFILFVFCMANLLPSLAGEVEDLIKKGDKHSYEGKYGEAITCYEKAIGLEPDNGDLWLKKGLAFKGLGKDDLSIKCYDKAIELAPKDFILCKDAFLYKGDALYNLGKYKEALECYEKTIEIEPENTLAINGKENVLNVLEDKTDKKSEAIMQALSGNVIILISMVMYLYICYWFMIIFRKLGCGAGWEAFIPFYNWYVLYSSAKINFWTNIIFYALVFFLIHFPLNVLANVLNVFLLKCSFIIVLPMPWLWMEVAYKLGKPSLVGYGMVIPVLNLIVLPYIATGEGKYSDVYMITEDAVKELEKTIDKRRLKSLDLLKNVKRNKSDLVKELQRLYFDEEQIDLILRQSIAALDKKSLLD